MSVYVDAAIHVRKGRKWCHMTADSLEELHAVAAAIGLKRCWFENKRGRQHPHYDLTEAQRDVAIAHGAIPAGRREYLNAVYRITGRPERRPPE